MLMKVSEDLQNLISSLDPQSRAFMALGALVFK